MMANFFWGVSDALDLYGEYISAKAQNIQKHNPLAIKAKAEKEIQPTTTEDNEADLPNTDYKENSEIDIDSIVCAASKKKFEGEKFCLKEISDEPEEETVDKEAQTHRTTHTTNKVERDFPRTKSKKSGEVSKNIEDKNTISDRPLSVDAHELKIRSEVKENTAKEVDSPKSLKADEHEDEVEEEEKNPMVVESLNNEIKNCIDEPSGCRKEDDTLSAKSSLPQEREVAGDDSCADPNCVGQETPEESKPSVLNVLIFGAGDPRHIIKTMAKRYTHCEKEGTASNVPLLKFYVVEGCIETIARNIALLGIALENPDLISLRNKVHLFMDVYGNTLLRPICHQYLVSKAATLLKMVSDKCTLKKIAPLIHIESLRYREMDALQDAFEFWQPKPGYEFNIADSWMTRLRRLLAVRYDARDGVFDWDLNMSLKDRGGEQICSQEYRYWRETGIAFTFPEYEQCKPNKTLAAGLVRNGGRYMHRGYIGDIQTGPFCTFGLRSVEERMHHSAHGENDYRATDITERNLLEYFHEIQKGTAYVHNRSLSHKYGGVRFQMGERLIHNESEDMKSISAYDEPWINVEGIEIHFLPLQEVKDIGRGSLKWKTFFDIAFVGYKYFDFITDAFTEVLNENSLLIFETKLRSVEIKTRIAEFEYELHGYARASRLLNVINYKALNSKNSILKFWKPDKIVQENINIE